MDIKKRSIYKDKNRNQKLDNDEKCFSISYDEASDNIESDNTPAFASCGKLAKLID